MTWVDRLGFLKYLHNLGKEYGDLFRGAVSGGAIVTFVAGYFGLGKVAAIVLGAALIPGSIAVAITAGWIVWNWRITHKTIEKEWENNPYLRAHIDTLRQIRDAVQARPWLDMRP